MEKTPKKVAVWIMIVNGEKETDISTMYVVPMYMLDKELITALRECRGKSWSKSFMQYGYYEKSVLSIEKQREEREHFFDRCKMKVKKNDLTHLLLEVPKILFFSH